MKFKVLLFTAAIVTTGLLAGNSAGDKIKHVVIFKYKAGATAEQINEVTQAFKKLKSKIPGIVSFEYGVNNSPEKLNKGFTHVYLLTFDNAASRDGYLPHPDHKEFGKLLTKLGVLEEPFVIDFEVAEVQ